MTPELTVVLCSLNGAEGVDRCLHALASQTIRTRMEIIVVDDGSTDRTADVAREHGVTVISHPTNRGLSAARNTGIKAARGDVVAFVDDDCEPGPEWAMHVLRGYEDESVLGVAGPVVPRTPPGFMSGYLTRNNPLQPLEAELATGSSLPYRFYLYLRRQWAGQPRTDRREVYSFIGANMSFRRKVLFEIGLSDERLPFGGEDLDLCMRLLRANPSGRLMFEPGASLIHHFEPELRYTLKRSKTYGRGSAQLYRKWPLMLPAIFPGPFVVLFLLAGAIWLPESAIAAILAPIVLYPSGVRAALRDRQWTPLLDGYVQLAQEVMQNVGYAHGTWLYRGSRWMGSVPGPVEQVAGGNPA